jgi:hypothetical protein
MRTGTMTALALAALLFAAAPAEAKGGRLLKVRGKLTAPEEESDAKGKFMLAVASSGDRVRERMILAARGLDADLEHEVLIGDDLDGAASFGELTVRGRGHAVFRFRSGRDDYPDGIDALADLGGQTIFVVADDEVVLEGDIPEFVEPGAGEEPGEGSFAFGIGAAKLSPPEDDDDSDARGRLVAAALDTPRGAREWIHLVAVRLDSDKEYGVWLIDGEDEDKLGTLRPRGRFGVAFLVLDTRSGHDLPDHLSELAGRTVEVRDSGDTVILEGEFPALE